MWTMGPIEGKQLGYWVLSWGLVMAPAICSWRAGRERFWDPLSQGFSESSKTPIACRLRM